MEDLAGKIVLSCSPEPGLTMCTALGKSILNKEASQVHELEAEVYPTLWWIFLNSLMDCTGSAWPHDNEEENPKYNITVTSDSTLTLTHFRDSRTRQAKAFWLTIVGVSGMFYAFSRYSYQYHEDGPAYVSNHEYFM